MTRTYPLPPRTRGQRIQAATGCVPWASTPAHAGPASAGVVTCPTRPLYPRARGASLADEAEYQWKCPLPPRTRGRHGGAPRAVEGGASTPAHAGPALEYR